LKGRCKHNYRCCKNGNQYVKRTSSIKNSGGAAHPQKLHILDVRIYGYVYAIVLTVLRCCVVL